MNKIDGEIKKVIEKNENINDSKIDYSFIKIIIQKKIGSLIDEFLILNMGNKINKYLADSFTRWIVNSFHETEIEIIKQIEEIIKNNKV